MSSFVEVYASRILSGSCTEYHPHVHELKKLSVSPSARSNPLEPSPCINTMVSPNFFETKFNKVIEGLGKFKLKKKESNLLMTFFLIKLQCKLPRFEYETIIVGDEYDEEDTARENAFAKAYSLLWNKFRQEMMTLEKVQNTYFPPRQGVMQYF